MSSRASIEGPSQVPAGAKALVAAVAPGPHPREAVGRLAAGVVHDVSNLVQIIELEARSLLETPADPAAVAEHAAAILEVNRRAQLLIGRLLSLRNHARHNPESIDVAMLLERLRPVLALAVGSRHPLHVQLVSAPCRVRFDPEQLEQVVIQLLLNAREASRGGGAVELRVERCCVGEAGVPPVVGMPAGDYCAIEVRDAGEGMHEEQLRRAFEPFFSTKGERGTGLGLATVHELVTLYHGFVSLQSVPAAGTRVCVLLPVAEHEHA